MRSVQNLLLHLLALAPFAIEPTVARRDRQDQNVFLPGPVIDSPGPVSNTVPPRHHEFVSLTTSPHAASGLTDRPRYRR